MKHAALKLSRSIFDDDSSEGETLKSPINGRASQPIGNWDVQQVAKETTSAPKSSVLTSSAWIGVMPHPGQIINYNTVDNMEHDVLPKSDEMFKALDTTSNSVEKNQEVIKTDSSIPVNTIKRMSYAEIEKNAREERKNALAAFKHHIFVQSDTAELTGCENDENDLFNDEWLERDTTSMQMRSSESLKTRTTKSKLRAKAHRQLDEDEVPTKSKSRKCEFFQADGQDVTQAKSDILNFQDNLNGLEHPSCELKPGCLRRGPIILPAFDPATEPTQKGIVGLSRFAIPAVSASEVNEACASRLLSHQIFGIEWLWRKYALGQGCILGDGT